MASSFRVVLISAVMVMAFIELFFKTAMVPRLDSPNLRRMMMQALTNDIFFSGLSNESPVLKFVHAVSRMRRRHTWVLDAPMGM